MESKFSLYLQKSSRVGEVQQYRPSLICKYTPAIPDKISKHLISSLSKTLTLLYASFTLYCSCYLYIYLREIKSGITGEAAAVSC